MEYFTTTTNAGDQAIAQAIQTGTTKTFKSIAVGDGNGTYYDPAKSQTALRREVWRGDAVVALDPSNSKRVIVMATIPATVGGFTIREAGILDIDGALMVISKLPLSEKVSPDSGASTDLVIRLYVEVSDVSAVSITIDPSAILATKGDISNALVPISADLQEQKNAAVRSATIDGAAVPKNGTELQLPAYPVVPTALKNPTALTFAVGNGGTTGTYDGSAAKTVSIPKVTLSTTATPSYTLAPGELYFSPN